MRKIVVSDQALDWALCDAGATWGAATRDISRLPREDLLDLVCGLLMWRDELDFFQQWERATLDRKKHAWAEVFNGAAECARQVVSATERELAGRTITRADLKPLLLHEDREIREEALKLASRAV